MIKIKINLDTIRTLDYTWSERVEETFEKPNNPYHLSESSPKPTIYVLGKYINKYKNLEWIPKLGRIWIQKSDDEVSIPFDCRQKIQRIDMFCWSALS
jgi:hypothetical protein